MNKPKVEKWPEGFPEQQLQAEVRRSVEEPLPDEGQFDPEWESFIDNSMSDNAVMREGDFGLVVKRPKLWEAAARQIDANGDGSMLLQLLAEGHPMLPRERDIIANVFKRHQMPRLKFKRETTKAGAAIPIYTKSEREVEVAYAVAEVRILERKKGMDRDKAIAEVEKSRGIAETTLRNAIEGRRRSSDRTGPQIGQRAKKKP